MTAHQQTLAARLAQHRTLGSAPPRELEWLAQHGRLVEIARGEVMTGTTQPVAALYVVLSGHLTIHVRRGGGPRLIAEWHAGDVTGVLPYSRLRLPPGDVVAQERTEVLALDRERLPELIRECHETTTILVHVMLDRARHFTSSDVQDEKMISLGKLAAGLAHELNNPASAVARNAREIHAALADIESASRELGAAGLSPAEFAAVDALRDSCLARAAHGALSPLDRSDREEALDSWLAAHDSDSVLAETLVDAGVGVDELDGLARVLPDGRLRAAIRWLAARCRIRQLALETEVAASRIHTLVTSVKRFTYMDRAAAPMPVDVGAGLGDTAAVLASKARARSASLVVEVEPGLPRVHAAGGELNQIWANLIENALDAVPPSGDVRVTAVREGDEVVVRVTDNGAGIPPDIRTRIFDPFFTTKPVGQGTGLGLDTVQRLVRQAHGTIDVTSRPGQTEFRVRLPVSPHELR